MTSNVAFTKFASCFFLVFSIFSQFFISLLPSLRHVFSAPRLILSFFVLFLSTRRLSQSDYYPSPSLLYENSSVLNSLLSCARKYLSLFHVFPLYVEIIEKYILLFCMHVWCAIGFNLLYFLSTQFWEFMIYLFYCMST